MSCWHRVALATNEYMAPGGSVRVVDQIELSGHDMTLRKDINCERDVDLARRMAQELGLPLHDHRRKAEERPHD